MAQPLRLLIIAPQCSLQSGTGDVAAALGHHVALVADGDQAIASLRANPADVLVCELGSDTRDMMRRALAVCPDLLLIALIPAGEFSVRAGEAMDAGVWDYLPQPGAPALIRAALRRAEAQVFTLRADEESQRRDGELRALQRATTAITASLDPDKVLDMILWETKEIMRVDSASVLLVDQAIGGLVFWASSDGAQSLAGLQVPIGRGIANWSVAHNESVLSNDAEGDRRFYSGIDRICEYRTRNLVAVPLRVQSQVIGALEAVNRAEGAFTSRDQALLEALALPAAAALQNALLHRRQREDRDLLQAAMSASSSGMTVIDATGKVAFYNAAAAKLFSLQDGELLGQDAVQCLAHYADHLKILTPQGATWRSLAESLTSATEDQNFMVAIQVNPPLVLDLIVAPVHYPSGAPVSRLVAWRDVTREQEIARWREELGYVIVHDLRNPLSLVRVGIEAALMFLPEGTNADALQGLALALQGAAQLERKTSILLAVNQLEAGTYAFSKVAISAPQLVDAIYSFYGFEAEERGVSLCADLPEALPTFYADSELLEWALGNLVYYAVKRSARPGSVTIGACAGEEGGVRISVASQRSMPPERGQPGLGPAEAAGNQAGAAFRAEGSSGMGLYFCRLAIEAHGGKFWAADDGRGRIFHIWLPTGEASSPTTIPYGA